MQNCKVCLLCSSCFGDLGPISADGGFQPSCHALLHTMCPTLPLAQLLEYGTLSAYGWSGWFSLWNGLDMATYVLQARGCR